MADPDLQAPGVGHLIALPVIPLPDGVVFPGAVVTLALQTPDAVEAVRAARAAGGPAGGPAGGGVLLVPQLDGRYGRVGTVAQVDQVGELPDGTQAVILRALHRAALGAGVPGDGAVLRVEAHPVVEVVGAPVDDVVRELRAVLEGVAEVRRSRRLPEILRTAADAGALADAVAGWAEAPAAWKQQVLEATDVAVRLRVVLEWATGQLAELRTNERIRAEVAEGIERNQREFLLRQQLQAIRKELGEGTDAPADGYRERLAALGEAMPGATRAFVAKEIDRLERTSEQSPEGGWIRTWLDRVFALPWGVTVTEHHDLVAARRTLDADHTGLDDVKERIIEELAVRALRRTRAQDTRGGEAGPGPVDRRSGVILCLVGPPGVGKTSLGESVARAMGRPFVRVALGGVRDEAEVRGHRRTYVGAQPGRIVRAVQEAGAMNPVLLLDEVDKLSAGGWSGDPTAALLEVLDPAQHHTFRDHYLEIELDLSDVVFIATANQLETIPAPLLDRMELVRLDGYTEDEKVGIGQDHLLPRQRERAGLAAHELTVTDAAIRRTVREHTREAGVRTLERELGRIARKAAARVADGDGDVTVTVEVEDVPTYLGRAKVHDEVAERTAVPGVATGLAVTGVGGDVLFIETIASPGEPGFTVTGQLGDVMRESAQISLSYVRANAQRLGIDPSAFDRRFHVHVPAGAVPKDGPSAGVTMTTALVSLLTGRTVKPHLGMTGEVTLQGKVLPIGGVKQKVLAAHRAGLTEVVVPRRNEPDLADVPEAVRSAMTFHLADRIDDVLDAALVPAVG